jgi:hypothetical protein
VARHVARGGQDHALVEKPPDGGVASTKKRSRPSSSVAWRESQKLAARRAAATAPFQCSCGFTAGTHAAWKKHSSGVGGNAQHKLVASDVQQGAEEQQKPQKRPHLAQRLQPSRPAPPPPTIQSPRGQKRTSKAPEEETPLSTVTGRSPAGARLKRLPFMEESPP